jgi:hypothetical protein
MKQVDRHQAREQTDEAGDDDKPPIVLGGKAIIYLKHGVRSTSGGVQDEVFCGVMKTSND